MKENFKEVIEDIKKTSIDQEETKKYILAIKRVVRKLYEICKDEQEESEILQEYLEDYENDLKFRGEAHKIFTHMLMHSASKRLLQDFKGNKANFNVIMREAKKIENESNRADIILRTDLKESMMSAIRYVIRTRGTTKEGEIIEGIQQEKALTDNRLKNQMIDVIRSSVTTLEEYGFIDEYINSSNEELEELGLSEFKYTKRNPIADEQYDENGNLVKDVEDIGVIDTFSRSNLEQLSIEDLEIMTAFWESKYLQERIGLSKAMSTIKTLDLWDTLLHEDDEAIQNLDPAKIESALKKDLAITYLYRNESEITNKMKKQYMKFLESEGLSTEVSLEDEVQSIAPDISNLEDAARDVGLLECLIVHQIKGKEIKIKKWGVIEDSEEEKEDEVEGITFAIENKNFRGPLVMRAPKSVLTDFLKEEGMDFPKYDKQLNNTYSSIMSKLYLPTNNYFNNLVKKSYKENPQSQVLADLAGKKVKKGEER